MRQADLPQGRFRYESGSYGNQKSGYMPSIFCYKEQSGESWSEHFCLVKPDTVLNNENEAVTLAEQHLANAHSFKANGGSIPDFALSLRHEGYKNVTDFKIIRDENRNLV